MADDIDRAQARALLDTELALKARKPISTSAGPPLLDIAGRSLCWQCNEPIPLERLAVQPEARFCAPCLAEIERRAKHRYGSPRR